MTDQQRTADGDATRAQERARAADAFLARAGWSGARRRPLAGDASNRRYERVARARLNGGPGAAVLMDAPPERGEDVRPFAALTEFLRGLGFSAPEIYAADADAGFLLLEDLGDDLFARVAATRPEDETALYGAAVDLLADLHAARPPEAAEGWGARHPVRPYDGRVLAREALLAIDWWTPGASARPDPQALRDLRDAFMAEIAAACAPVADARDVVALRDYHAENLIWLPGRAGAGRVGLLDYQDALAGHPAYDLVSLLEDARRDVAPDLAEAMTARFLARRGGSPEDQAAFRAGYAILGAQRNLKIIGIFARLWLRDGKARYLAHIPRVWGYLQRDLAHPALTGLRALIAARVPEPTPERLARLTARGGARDGGAMRLAGALLDTTQGARP